MKYISKYKNYKKNKLQTNKYVNINKSKFSFRNKNKIRKKNLNTNMIS